MCPLAFALVLKSFDICSIFCNFNLRYHLPNLIPQIKSELYRSRGHIVKNYRVNISKNSLRMSPLLYTSLESVILISGSKASAALKTMGIVRRADYSDSQNQKNISVLHMTKFNLFSICPLLIFDL